MQCKKMRQLYFANIINSDILENTNQNIAIENVNMFKKYQC